MQKATRAQLKEHNLRLVLKTVYHEKEISRADIARATRLTRTTVSDIVGELMDEGLLEETGYGTSVGGKPPILLNLVEDARQLVCVDLSGDDIQGALVNLRGKISERVNLPLECVNGHLELNCVFDLIDNLVGCAAAPLVGIGIGSPGLIDSANGIIHQAVNLGWKDLPLKQLLSQHYDLPIYIANDSQIAALAEYTFGDLRRANNLVVIKVGRGISSGIVLNGQIYSGDGFSAGEIGHLMVVEDGLRCTCGNYGCLETVSSTRAILSQVSQMDGHSDFSSLDKVFQAYRSGDRLIQEVVNRAGGYLGVAIANLISILNIHNIVISGNVVGFGDPLLGAARAEVEKRVLSKMARETRISYSSLGANNVILGASALLLSEEFGIP
jgi:N-acetylglucosamine repressor